MAIRSETAHHLTESTSLVTYEEEFGLFRATFDSECDSTSLAVVEVIATVNAMDPMDLTPLQRVIDTTALDDLTSMSDGGAFDSVRFRYENCQVTVRSEGVIEAIPLSCT